MSDVRPLESGRVGQLLLVAASLVAAAVLVVLAMWSTDEEQPAVAGADGVAETPPAACDPVRGTPAVDNNHVDGPVRYSAPPASGDHSGRWAVLPRSFYTVADRPDVPVLVHNLEHGYNVLWYDQTIIDSPEALEQLRRIAAAYSGSGRDPTDAFIAAPWTASDGGAMPAGRHYALTHWYADPAARTRARTDEVGYTMYCGTVTAEVVQRWMADYPLRDAPEGYRVNM